MKTYESVSEDRLIDELDMEIDKLQEFIFRYGLKGKIKINLVLSEEMEEVLARRYRAYCSGPVQSCNMYRGIIFTRGDKTEVSLKLPEYR